MSDFSKEQIDFIAKAVDEWGLDKVIKRASEELLELSLSLLHYDRNKATVEDIKSEIADVRIVCKHLELRFGDCQAELDKKILKCNS